MWVSVFTHAVGWHTVHEKCEPVPKGSSLDANIWELWNDDWSVVATLHIPELRLDCAMLGGDKGVAGSMGVGCQVGENKPRT